LTGAQNDAQLGKSQILPNGLDQCQSGILPFPGRSLPDYTMEDSGQSASHARA